MAFLDTADLEQCAGAEDGKRPYALALVSEGWAI